MLLARENKILKDSLDIIVKKLNPEKIILFGSRAKNTNNKSSDFDIAVESDKIPGKKEIRELNDLIDEKSGLYTVDIIFIDKKGNKFSEIIKKTGKIIYERRINA
jgi:predicted nucleotidyltransferase